MESLAPGPPGGVPSIAGRRAVDERTRRFVRVGAPRSRGAVLGAGSWDMHRASRFFFVITLPIPPEAPWRAP